MVKKSMDDLLKRRMSAAQQASELEVGNEAYETMFQAKADAAAPRFCELPIKSLCPFRTADIGFRPYPPEKLRAFSQQLAEQGIYERIIVRPIPNSEQYEILAGHNRTEAWRLTGHSTIPAEVVEADDARAISIAVATNLLRRQDLTIIERGKAYRALLDENNRHGQRNATPSSTTFGDSRQKLDGDSNGETFGENRQRYNARKIVADFFGVTEYEIRKAIKLAALIPPLADILENSPRKLPIACAELIADYEADSQRAFVEMCTIEGYVLNKSTIQKIAHTCPPPSAEHQDIYAAWRQARADEEMRRAAPPTTAEYVGDVTHEGVESVTYVLTYIGTEVNHKGAAAAQVGAFFADHFPWILGGIVLICAAVGGTLLVCRRKAVVKAECEADETEENEEDQEV